jgi:hypothetical protein
VTFLRLELQLDVRVFDTSRLPRCGVRLLFLLAIRVSVRGGVGELETYYNVLVTLGFGITRDRRCRTRWARCRSKAYDLHFIVAFWFG